MHIIRTFILFAFLLSTTVACDKTPVNGGLDGKWHLLEMYSKADAGEEGYSIPSDKRAENIYWSFQLKLLHISSTGPHNGKTGDTFARFTYSGDRLSIDQTYIHFRDRDSLVTAAGTTVFEGVGIRGNATEYRISKLTGSDMILCSQRDSLVFFKIR